MEFRYGYTCPACGATKTLVFDPDKANRPPAPYDVPRKVVCGVGDCEEMMERTNQ